jgi:hypothetical protein
VTQHVRLPNTTHAFDDESPPEKPVDRCWYSPNPHWCTSSGGRNPATGNCHGAPKPDFCSEAMITRTLRQEVLDFLKQVGAGSAEAAPAR